MGSQAGSATRQKAPGPIRAGQKSRLSAPRTRSAWLVAVGIVLAALNLRPAITSLGALLEEVRDGLGMSGTVAGLLTSVPPLCFAVFGVMAPRLARRFGPGAVVCAGMVAITVGVALRSFAGGTVVFLLLSACALMGIAVSNVLMPVIVKRWFPDRVGTMTGLYSMALALGTSWAAAVTVPLTDALGGNWRSGLGTWAVLGVVAVLPWIPLVRHHGPVESADAHAREAGSGTVVPEDGSEEGTEKDSREGTRKDAQKDARKARRSARENASRDTAEGAAEGAAGEHAPKPLLPGVRGEDEHPREAVEPATPTGHVPDRLRIAKSPTAWALAVFFGLQASGAYITMGWMAQVFRDSGLSADSAGLLLALIMVMGVPLAFVIPRVAVRLPHQGPMVVVLGACGLVGYTGLYLAPVGGALAWALLLGISNCAFPLALTMVGMRASTGAGVAQLSAFAQSTGYLISIPGPLLIGVLYQHSGGWGLPIALMAGLMVPQILVGVLAGRDRTIEAECAVRDAA